MLMMSCIINLSVFAQKSNTALANEYLTTKGEVIFNFIIENTSELSEITKELAIVHYNNDTKTVKVMANENQFALFLQKKTPFTVFPEDNVIGYKTMTTDLAVKATTFPLTAYPTYDDYETIMNEFVTNHPSICSLENIGTTTEGDKSLLFIKLSDNVASNEQEPRIMYTSSMHGDEIAGYPMMLNLINFLVEAYTDTANSRHAEIKDLLDNNEVWINPLANPDGTFNNSPDNSSVANATRGNANNVDLNRNYPDPDDGANPDGNPYQTETIAFMDFTASKHFVLSANFHGGIELINYPWDTYAGAHPDEDYFIQVCEEYRDLCQANSPSGYFDALNNGITNGYDWYEVQGGRQDYQIYFEKGREVTVELSDNKTPNSSLLDDYWNYNQEALLAFLKQINYGIRGVVTDAVTNQGIAAKITIVGRENYESWTPTELPEGDYYRPIEAGTYDILYEAECYESVVVTDVSIANYSAVIQNVQLTPITDLPPTGLVASNIQTTTATLNWDNDSDTDYDIRYRIVDTTDWTEISIDTATLNLTGLLFDTQYEAQVRSNCIGGVSSPYSDSVIFTTLENGVCAVIGSFPYYESFESDFGVWTNVTSDIDWTRNSGGTPSSATGPSNAQDGSFYIYTEASSNVSPPGNPNMTAILESPCIDLSISNPAITFGYHMYGSSMGSLELLVSTDAFNYTSIWSISGNLGDEWNQNTVDLSSYSGQVIFLQFRGTTGTSWQSDMAIDDIRIESSNPDTEAPSIPTGLAITSVTANSIGVSWDESIDNIGVSEYEIYQDNNLIGSATSTNYSAIGLEPNTSYSFSIIAKDTSGNSSGFSNTISATTLENTISYCTSQGNNVSYEYIDYVELGGISNESGANSGYTDFTNLVGAINFGANNIILRVGFANAAYNEYWGVWIDYDQNGVFDASEQIVSALTNTSTNESYSFVVPETALSGITRMRVSMKYNTAPDACETFTYGEVEDYTIQIGTSSLAKTKNIVDTDVTDILLYPNPNKDGVLFIEGFYSKKMSFTIINAMGQNITSDTVTNNQIDVSGLPNGVYMLKINAQKSITKMFVIDK